MTLRSDLALVADRIEPGSRVLDLGCSTGALLSELTRTKGCAGTGVEIDADAVLAAIRSGVPIIELDMDHELTEFADSSYDVVVLSRTLQTLHRPFEVLQEMIRIAPRIISESSQDATPQRPLRPSSKKPGSASARRAYSRRTRRCTTAPAPAGSHFPHWSWS